MLEIPLTTVATSYPLNLTAGFALFPDDQSRLARVLSGTMTGTLCNFGPTDIVLFNLSCSATYELFHGICGPSYALEMDIEGSAEEGALKLTVSEDELQAGMTFGITLGFDLKVKANVISLYWVWDGWHTKLKHRWQILADLNIKLEFDLLEILYELFWAAVGDSGEGGEKMQEIAELFKGGWGFFDEKINTFNGSKGILRANPGDNLHMDISGKFPQFIPFNEALKAFHGHFSFGPSVGYIVPVTVQMKSVTLDETKYTWDEYDTDLKQAVFRTSGADPTAASTVNVELEHTVDFDLTAGVYASLNLAKLFNIGFSIKFPLLALLGLDLKLGGPYDNTIPALIGQNTEQASVAGGSGTFALMDVVFEPPGGLC